MPAGKYVFSTEIYNANYRDPSGDYSDAEQTCEITLNGADVALAGGIQLGTGLRDTRATDVVPLTVPANSAFLAKCHAHYEDADAAEVSARVTAIKVDAIN